MIDWTVIEEVIQEWANQQSEIPFVWRNRAEEYKKATDIYGVYGVLAPVFEQLKGRDEVRQENKSEPSSGRDLVTEIVGNRLVQILVEVHSRDQRAQNNSWSYCSKLMTSLRSPSVLDTLRNNNITIARINQIIGADGIVDDRWESIARFSVDFNVGFSVIDPCEEVGAIESVVLTSDYRDVDQTRLPDSLQVTDKEIPE